MQLPTHLLAGIAIERLANWSTSSRIRHAGICAIGGLLSHGVLDRLARITYHPPNPLWDDGFWLGFHIIVVSTGILIFFCGWPTSRQGMLWSMAPDLDWLVRFIRTACWGKDVGEAAIIHDLVYRLVDHIPGLNLLSLLPQRQLFRVGALVEIGIVLSFILILLFTRSPIIKTTPCRSLESGQG